MKIYKNMKSTKDKVTYFLETAPHLRDDDNRLIACIYFNEIGKQKLEMLNGVDLLRMLAEGKLIAPESIRRVRQKIQEERPELRGKTYKARIKQGEEVSKIISKDL